MKLRLTHNSIRIRVRKSELAVLTEKKLVKEEVRFPTNTGVLSYSLSLHSDKNDLDAQMIGSDIQVMIPIKLAEDWINTNKVGLESSIALAENEKLHLLIEKDFPCLDRPNEDKSDTFWELTSENSDSPQNC